MKTAVLVSIVLGRYHLARLVTCRTWVGLRLEVVEVAQTFGDLPVPGGIRCRSYKAFSPIHTLFPGQDYYTLDQETRKRALFEKLSKLSPSAVLVSGYGDPMALCALSWAAQNEIPAVLLSDTHALAQPRSWPKEWVKQRLMGLYSAAFVAGKPQAEYLVGLGFARDRIFSGYDVVDNHYFAPGPSESAKVASCSSLTNRTQFLVPGRLVPEKNLFNLLRAYRIYATAAGASAWRLKLLGDGPLRCDVERETSSSNLDGLVDITGFQAYERMPAFYASAGAAILASVSETWGLVVNEAMASGLPVLVSNRCGCAQDLVQDGVNGFTFDPYDVEQLAQTMLRVASLEQGVRGRMGAESARIIAGWGPERFASGLKQAVDKALEVGPVKPTFLQRLILRALLSR